MAARSTLTLSMVIGHATARFHRVVAHPFITRWRAPTTIGESALGTADAPLAMTRGGRAWNLFMSTSDGG
jgi:hypothetical protein